MIKDDEDMLKLFEKLPDYLISEDKLEQTATVLKVFIRSLRPNCFHNLILLKSILFKTFNLEKI